MRWVRRPPLGGGLRRSGCLGLVLLLVLGAALALARPIPPHPWFSPRPGQHQPLVFAHQGGENLWPSNTMLAFQKSADLGVDVLDTDVHLSKDGVLVMIHDATVERTTDGQGAVAELSADQLARLDAGYRFSPDGRTYPFRGQGLGIPRLEELLERFPAYRLGVELKTPGPQGAHALALLLRKHQAAQRVLVSSFHQSALDAIRRECPEVATSASPGEGRTFWVLSRLGLEGVYSPPFHSLQVPMRQGSLQVVTAGLVRAAHRRGVAVQPWTLNQLSEFDEAMAMGVDGINTDYPDRLLHRLTR